MYLALHGHVDAGGYWEARCTKEVLACGWTQVEGWDSTFFHPKYGALLVIYVDDFKMACKKEDSQHLWKGLRSRLSLSAPEPPDRFLGCHLKRVEMTCKEVSAFLENDPLLHPRTDEAQGVGSAPKVTLKDPDHKVSAYV